jgi:hypothetical protein
MKKALLLTMVLFLLSIGYTSAQLSKFVKNVKNNVQKELLGDKNSSTKTMPEPASACADAQLIVDLGGKLKVDYAEISITSADDGSVLIQDRNSSSYYIAKDGQIQGPFNQEDPKMKAFGITSGGGTNFMAKYSEYISKSGDKFLITFMGKKYGPYARIDNFVATKSREKFAAIVAENVMITEEQGRKMETAMKNAKTDEEKMNLSMEYAQLMQSNMVNNDPASVLPKFITNITGATYDPIKNIGSQFSDSYKYDDILLLSYDKIMDLKGKTIFSFGMNGMGSLDFFVSTDNLRYASYSYGTLTFNDKSTLAEIFNPHWLKADGKVYLAYMYYSPKKNALMQCKIPF